MFSVLRNISLLGALLFVVYIIGNYGGPVKSQLLGYLNIKEVDVKGASTQRAQEISDKFQSDISDQAGFLADPALNLRVADAITFFSRLQQIPRDIQSVHEYSKEQIDNFSKKK